MGLRFFADQCVPHEVVQTLRGASHEVFWLRDHLRCDAPDPEVITKAQELLAILLSLNGDFSDIVAYPPSEYGGIIALQVKNHPEAIPEMMDRLLKYLTLRPDMDHYRGRLLLVQTHRIRIRQ